MKSGFMQSARATVEMASGLAIVAIAVILVWRTVVGPGGRSEEPQRSTTEQNEQPPPTDPVPLVGAPVKGNQSAPIVIVEYADFECPACQRFVQQTYRPLLAKYVDSGRVRLVYKHFPLPNHAFSESAAFAAECAAEQGQFWAFYESIFNRTAKLDATNLAQTSKTLDLDPARWNSCRNSTKLPAVIQANLEEARRFQLRGTPTFLIGTVGTDGRLRTTKALFGARPLSDFDTAIAQAEKTLIGTK